MVTAAVVVGAAFGFWMIWAIVTNPRPAGRPGATSVPGGVYIDSSTSTPGGHGHGHCGDTGATCDSGSGGGST